MTEAATGAVSSGVTWRLWMGPLVWAAHFLAIYGFTALACERNVATEGWFGIGIVTWFIAAATLAAVTALLVTIGVAVRDGARARSAPAPSAFVHWLTAAVAGLVLLAVLWETLLPMLLVPVCG